MKTPAKNIIKETTKIEDGIIYQYLLTSSRSVKVASYGMPLYSIEVIMTKDGEVTKNEARDIFSDIGKAVVFFDKISNNLATPMDLPYILEDMGCRI